MINFFKFRSVGQGLFYTGSLNDGEFNFVYDCGTESAQYHIEKEINIYTSNLLKKEIDFAVISHLHKDHFSGLVSLMNKIPIKKIFLPYLGRRNGNLVRLIVAHTIISDKDIYYENYINSNLNLYYKIIELYQNSEDNLEGRPRVELLGEETSKEDIFSNFNYSKKDILDYDPFWEFTLFNKRINNQQLESLENKIFSVLGELGISTIEECLEDKERIKKIKDVYKAVFGRGNDLNLNSTIMIHYPCIINNLIIGEGNSFPSYRKMEKNDLLYHWKNMCVFWVEKSIATVLTGDAKLDTEMLEFLVKELKNKYLGVLQVPHHGSKSNWQSLENLKAEFLCYVIPFGLGNKYNHPNSIVIYDIIMQDKKLYLATQAHPVRYIIETIEKRVH